VSYGSQPMNYMTGFYIVVLIVCCQLILSKLLYKGQINVKSSSRKGPTTFCREIATDNDMQPPKRAIRTQRDIIGDSVNEVAEHCPDFSHIIKDTNNDLFKTRDNDCSLNSRYCLSNARIKSIHTDIRESIKEYNEKRGDSIAIQSCLDQLGSIICHHCGDHSKYKNENFCTYRRVKKANPNWDEDQIRQEAALQCKLHGGRTIDLLENGIATLEKIIDKRFNMKSIDHIAKLRCTNDSEKLWQMASVFSEGKRLNLYQIDI